MLAFLEGHTKLDRQREQNEWERTRRLGHRLLSGFVKMPAAESWWPMPWDSEESKRDEINLTPKEFLKAFGAVFGQN